MDDNRSIPNKSAVLAAWASSAAKCVNGDCGLAAAVALIEAEAPAMFREMGRVSDSPLGVLKELWNTLTIEQLLEVVPIDSDVLARSGRRVHWAIQAIADGQFEAMTLPPYDPVTIAPTPAQIRRSWADAAQKYLRAEVDLLDAYWLILCADRDYYNELADDPRHPLNTVRAFFSQLSSRELHKQEPIPPDFLAACSVGLNKAFAQLAEAGEAAIDVPPTPTRFLFVTDLHGDSRAYAALPDLCAEHGLRIIVQGGDMLPKGRDMFAAQREFLSRELPQCLDRCASRGIEFYGLFGNDDLRGVHDIWLTLARSMPGVYDLAQRWHTLPGGFTIRGCSWVPDYLFGLKDWCLRDRPDATPVFTRGRSIITSPDGVAEIDDPVAFFASRPTLEEHLDSIVGPGDSMERAVLVSHAPPAHLGLGMLWSGEDVGSQSVHGWVTRHQSLLVLSGHIHESPDVGLANHGEPRHTAMLGRTTCHQPGQALPDELNYSIVELDQHGSVRLDWRQMRLSR